MRGVICIGLALALALSIDHTKIFHIHAWLVLPCYHLIWM